jgi:hypothetical protein
MSDNDVYYRLYLNRHDELVVVCMQWFDEYDYDQKRFLSEERYYDEDEADLALIEWKKQHNILLSMAEIVFLSRKKSEED